MMGDFSTVSVTEGFAKRLEVGYTTELHTAGKDLYSTYWNTYMEIVHVKGTVLPENFGKTKWVPAIAVGAIYRFHDNYVGDGTNPAVPSSGQPTANADYYLVGTKTVKFTPAVSLLLSGGVKRTNSEMLGLGGNAPSYTERGFGALALAFTGPAKSSISVGSEVSQQPHRELYGNHTDTVDNIPSSEAYLVRIAPSPKCKLNIDAGVLHLIGHSSPSYNFNANARAFFGLSYGF